MLADAQLLVMTIAIANGHRNSGCFPIRIIRNDAFSVVIVIDLPEGKA